MDVGEIIKYEFKNQDLLIRACTHVTYDEVANSNSLESVGDATLELYVAKRIYDTDPENITQHQIHVLGEVNIDNEILARACLACGLEQHLRHGDMNVVHSKILKKFRQDIQDYPIYSHGRIDAPKFLADIVEAIIGAVWVDSEENMEPTGDVAGRILGDLVNDYEKYKLKPIEQYNLVKERFNLSDKVDTAEGVPRCTILMDKVRVIAKVIYNGSRKALRNRAASDAIEYLRIHRGLQI